MNRDRIFTDYIESLRGGQVIDIPAEVQDKLSKILRKALKRRGLWWAKPQLLDYTGSSWADADTFSELVYDCFASVFYGMGDTVGSQLDFLIEQVRAGNEIDRLVYTKVQHFVHDLHRKASPKGANVFKNLTFALRQLVADETPKLSVVSGDSHRFDNDSVFGKNGHQLDPLGKELLDDYVRGSDAWAPALKKISRFNKRANQLTRDAVESTADEDKVPFRFGDLKDVVSDHAYEPAANLEHGVEFEFEGEEGEKPSLVRTTEDPARYENLIEDFEKRVNTTHEAIDGLRRRDSIKNTLHQVLDSYARRISSGDDYSQAEIGRELGIARQTMSDYMKTLRELLESNES